MIIWTIHLWIDFSWAGTWNEWAWRKSLWILEKARVREKEKLAWLRLNGIMLCHSYGKIIIYMSMFLFSIFYVYGIFIYIYISNSHIKLLQLNFCFKSIIISSVTNNLKIAISHCFDFITYLCKCKCLWIYEYT